MRKRLIALLLVIAALTCALAACNGTVTVTFDPQNGEKPTTVTFDEYFQLPENPVREGYTFIGWYLDKNGDVSWTQPDEISANITVYAGWKQKTGNEVTVTFNPQNGEASTVVTFDANFQYPVNPTREGYTFTGWYTTSNCTTLWQKPATLASDVIVYAGWKKTNANEVTVTFDLQNGQTPIVVTFDDDFSVPNAPTRNGYTFTGWYTTSECKTLWQIPATLTSDITVYAGWQFNGSDDPIADLSQVFAQYDDYDKWNFTVRYLMYVNNNQTPSESDVLKFQGFDCAMEYVVDNVTYVDYLVYDAAKEQEAYYCVDENGDYQRYYREDDAAEYEQVYQMDYIELCNLATLSFTQKDGYYAAINPSAAGNEILGPYDGETYTEVSLYVENGKITQIAVASEVQDGNSNYTAMYILLFSNYGTTHFTLPQVGSGGSGGDIGGGDEPATLKDRFLGAVVTTPQAGTTYKLALYHAQKGKVLYWTGEHTTNYTWYMKTTEDVSKAADVVIEQTSGGFYLKCVKTGEYLEMTERSDKAGSGTLALKTSRPTTVMSTDSRGIITISGSSASFFLGSSDNYDTISASNVSYISNASVIDVSQYPARFLPQTGVPESGSGTTEKVTLNKTYLNLEVDGTDVLTATATSGGEITWTSSNPNVAKVVDGTVTAVAKGTATITATCGSAKATCTVNVYSAEESLGWNEGTVSDIQTPVLQQAMHNYTGDYGVGVGLPSIGTYDCLVVPVKFTNTEVTHEDLQNLNTAFNDTTGATGWESVKTFYQKESFGKLNLNFNILGYNIGTTDQVFNARYESIYYEKYVDEYGPYGSEYVLQEVLEYLTSTDIDLSHYDTNNDGYIDAIYLIYSANVNYNDDDSMWWAYVTWAEDETSYQGKKANYYMFTGLDFMHDDMRSGRRIAINAETYIHETGHLLGLDDYYDYKIGTGSDRGMGGASMQDFNIGEHDPYSKIMLGWLEPTIANANTTFTINLADSSTANDVLLIRLDNKNTYFSEYLLVDLYTATGLNEISKEGMFDGADYGVRIFHVDSTIDNPYSDNYYSFTDNNNSVSADCLIELLEADGGNTKNTNANSGYWAAESDLWGISSTTKNNNGTTLSNYSGNANLKNVTVVVSNVSATQATISVTFN